MAVPREVLALPTDRVSPSAVALTAISGIDSLFVVDRENASVRQLSLLTLTVEEEVYRCDSEMKLLSICSAPLNNLLFVIDVSISQVITATVPEKQRPERVYFVATLIQKSGRWTVGTRKQFYSTPVEESAREVVLCASSDRFLCAVINTNSINAFRWDSAGTLHFEGCITYEGNIFEITALDTPDCPLVAIITQYETIHLHRIEKTGEFRLERELCWVKGNNPEKLLSIGDRFLEAEIDGETKCHSLWIWRVENEFLKRERCLLNGEAHLRVGSWTLVGSDIHLWDENNKRLITLRYNTVLTISKHRAVTRNLLLGWPDTVLGGTVKLITSTNTYTVIENNHKFYSIFNSTTYC